MARRSPSAKQAAGKRSTGRKRSSSAKDTPRTPVIDIGGTKIKLLSSGETEPRRTPSGKRMTPTLMVDALRELAAD